MMTDRALAPDAATPRQQARSHVREINSAANVVIATRELDLKSLGSADFGDAEPAQR
jgi:hypothetical protein